MSQKVVVFFDASPEYKCLRIMVPAGDDYAKDIPADALDVCECDVSEIPADRTFRDAWKRGAAAVEVDMPAARALWMDRRIRPARDAMLKALDGWEFAAMSTGDQTQVADVRAKKQALRDIPETCGPQIEAAATPDELKVIWPAELN